MHESVYLLWSRNTHQDEFGSQKKRDSEEEHSIWRLFLWRRQRDAAETSSGGKVCAAVSLPNDVKTDLR